MKFAIKSKRKCIIQSSMIALSMLMLMSLAGCGKKDEGANTETGDTTDTIQQPESLYSESVSITDAEAEALAEKFMKLSEARLCKSVEEIDAIAQEILEPETYVRFKGKFNQYLASTEESSSFFSIEDLMKQAEANYNSRKQTLFALGLLNEDGTYNPNYKEAYRQRKAESEASTEASLEGNIEEAESGTEEAAEEATEPETESGVLYSSPIVDTGDPELYNGKYIPETLNIEKQAKYDTDNLDIPMSVEELPYFMEANYIGTEEGEDVVQPSGLDIIIDGFSSWLIPDTVEPLEWLDDWWNMPVEEAYERCYNILYCQRLEYWTLAYQRQADIGFTDEESYQQQLADYEALQESLRESKEASEWVPTDDGPEDDTFEMIPVDLVMAAQTYDWTNPEVSSLVRYNGEGERCLYWEDLNGQTTGDLTLVLYNDEYTINLNDKNTSTLLDYSDTNYVLNWWKYWVNAFDEEYPYSITQNVYAEEGLIFSLTIEYKINKDGQIFLTNDQIESIFEYSN